MVAHLYVAHVRHHHLHAIGVDELPHKSDSLPWRWGEVAESCVVIATISLTIVYLLIGCHLGSEVAQVVMEISCSTAARVLAWGIQ